MRESFQVRMGVRSGRRPDERVACPSGDCTGPGASACTVDSRYRIVFFSGRRQSPPWILASHNLCAASACMKLRAVPCEARTGAGGYPLNMYLSHSYLLLADELSATAD